MKKLLMTITLFAVMFTTQSFENSSIDLPDIETICFSDSDYNEAKSAYASTWKEISNAVSEEGYTPVDIYFNYEADRWLPVLEDKNGETVYTFASGMDCTGMGCEYGCCEICFGTTTWGEFCVSYCCECSEVDN